MRIKPITLFLSLSMLLSSVDASTIDEDLQREYDLVAVVKIDSFNDKYESAYNVTVERIIFLGIDEAKNANDGVSVGDSFVLIKNEIIKKDLAVGKSKVKTHSIRDDGCPSNRDYPIGKRLRLFSIKMESGFYKNNACTLTKVLDQN